jgi:hypothetical protein
LILLSILFGIDLVVGIETGLGPDEAVENYASNSNSIDTYGTEKDNVVYAGQGNDLIADGSDENLFEAGYWIRPDEPATILGFDSSENEIVYSYDIRRPT